MFSLLSILYPEFPEISATLWQASGAEPEHPEALGSRF